jgi:hypothetical protein
MQFPTDAITVYTEQVGAGSKVLIATGTKTILGVQSSQSGIASYSTISCGTTTIMKNYGKDFPFTPVNIVCNSAINYYKTGNDSVSFIVSYVNYNLSTFATTTTVSSSSLPIGAYTGANFQEWLFVAGVIIFLLSFMVWGRIFKPIKTLYEK